MSKRIQVSMSDTDGRFLEVQAKKRRLSLATLVRWIVGNWIIAEKSTTPPQEQAKPESK